MAAGSMPPSFLILPVIIGVFGGIGGSTRWYRTIFLEEIGRDYVRTARAKGLPERVVLFRHVLRNAMIPILTGVVVVIPTLFMGSLLTESFFGIPGLGSYTIDAINAQDFAVVRSMVFIGSVLYIVGLLADRHLLHHRRSAGEAAMSMPVVLWTDALLFLLIAAASAPDALGAARATTCGLLGPRIARAAWRWRRRRCWRPSSSSACSIRCITGAPGGRSPASRCVMRSRCTRCSMRCCRLAAATEKTYSAPLATHLYAKEDRRAAGRRSATSRA
jgi:hypothetical protein